MSAFPTCPTHGLLKPCQHCEPSKWADPLTLCGDAERGDELTRCGEPGCGKLRSKYRGHGYRSYGGYGYDHWGGDDEQSGCRAGPAASRAGG